MENTVVMTKAVDRTEIRKTHVEFGVIDQRGREIGANISEWEVSMVPLPEDHRGCYSTLAPGCYFALRTQATRNGLEYGATQSSRHFSTEAERIRALGSYLRTAELRAKKMGTVVEVQS